MFQFLLVFFFIDTVTPVISSTQIACDVVCVQHEVQSFLHRLQFFFYKEFFLQTMAFIRKTRDVNVYFTNKLISYCIFETKKI